MQSELETTCIRVYLGYFYLIIAVRPIGYLPVIPSDPSHHVELAKDVHHIIKVNFIGVFFIRL